MKLNKLFQLLAEKVGLDLTDAQYADILSSSMELPEDVSKLSTELITKKEAVKIPEVRNQVIKSKLEPVDKFIKDQLTELKLSDEVIQEIDETTDTREKIKLFLSKQKEFLEKESKGSSKDLDEYKKQLADSVKKAQEYQVEIQNAKDQSQIEINNFKRDIAFDSILNSNELYIPEGFTREDIKLIAKSKIENSILEKKWRKEFKDGNLAFVTEEGTPAFSENNTPVDVTKFVSSFLEENKLLKKSEFPTKETKEKTAQITTSIKADNAASDMVEQAKILLNG